MVQRDQVVGCLLGKCVADALGVPAEGRGVAAAAQWVEHLRASSVEEIAESFIGQYTDDSQLARELMISCVERGGFDPADYARRIADLFDQRRVYGAGAATKRAAERLLWGVAWDQAGEPAPAAGNGTAMRAAPVGLLHAGDADAMARVAHEQGVCTHLDPRCSAGAAAIAGAVSAAARGGALDTAAFCAEVADLAARFDEPLAADIRALPGMLDATTDEAGRQIARAGRRPEDEAAQPYHWEGISPFVVPSVLWSLYAFLREPEDYLAAVILAIEPGGDTDTTAAMTGAISGARLGVEAVPRELRALINDFDEWEEAELTELAEAFWELGR
ncbi:MAG: ADP-ribosylglycohydrolase family protein [Phycisphaerales bacterium JB039]